MFKNDWWNAKTQRRNICIGWLYNNRIQTPLLTGISQNLAEYDSVEMGIFCDKQFADDTIKGLLTQAYNAGFEKIVVFKHGQILKYFENVFPEFYEAHTDAKFVGHILDMGDEYYSVHPQCFMIDLEWWADNDMPAWGDENECGSWTTLAPKRSIENHHDGYTPHWIAPGDTERTYKKKQGGWNIVQALLADNQTIYSWDKKVRESKEYLYAEVKEDCWRNLFWLHEQMITEIFFVGNTELATTPEEIKDIEAHNPPLVFNKVVVPAAGISPLLYAKNWSLPKYSEIVIFDISLFALDCTKYFVENWDGKDLPSFMERLMTEKSGNSEQRRRDLFRGIPQITDTHKLIESMPDWQEWYDEYASTYKFKYIPMNLMNPNRYRNFAMICRQENRSPGATYVHLSNIFHYMPTAATYSLEQRITMFNELHATVAEQSYNNNILIKSASPLLINELKSVCWVEDFEPKEWDKLDKKTTLGKFFKWNN